MTVASSASSGECIEQSATDPAAEAELVRASREGSGQAARELVRLHHRRIFNYICQMTRQPQDAEDITQETFIKAFKNLHRFDLSRPFANWLFTIARRTAFNHFRAARTWVTIPEDTASAQPSPALRAEERDAVEDLWERAKRALNAREYEVLWLRFGENLSTEETARATRLTVPHVKVLVYRARQRLMAHSTPS